MPSDEFSDMFNEEGDPKTAFNSSLDIIQRISRLEYSLISCFLSGKLDEAFKFLRLIYAEIDFKLKPEDLNEIDDFIYDLKRDMVEALKTYNKNGVIYINNPLKRDNFNERLFELKRVLSKLKYQVGLGMADMSDPRYALLNG